MTFNRAKGYSDRPVTVACGQCASCRLKRAQSWALRCVHEASEHEKNCFVTLTYDQAHVPFDGGLHVRDWQLFAKRLRKRVGSFRFFHVGEYGEMNLRPHYHALLFGIDFREDSSLFVRRKGYDIRVSPTLSTTWGLGFATVGDLTFESAAYCARYAMKKITGPRAEEHYRRIDVETGEEFNVRPEYVTMSRRPGIGSDWFRKYGDEVFPDDFVVHNGKKFPVPRFYDRELERMDPAFMEGVRRARLKRAQVFDASPDRLAARERLVDQKLGETRREV